MTELRNTCVGVGGGDSVIASRETRMEGCEAITRSFCHSEGGQCGNAGKSTVWVIKVYLTWSVLSPKTIFKEFLRSISYVVSYAGFSRLIPYHFSW